MAERILLPGQDDGSRFLEMYLRECIYLNTDSDAKYMLPKPYEYAEISQIKVDPSKVVPTAKYVLRSNLTTIEELDKELLKEGINIFDLHGVIEIDDNNYMCPPILEIWNEPPYNSKPVIVDGAHRLHTAIKKGVEVNCVVISGKISSMLPVLPLAGWHEVFEQDVVPKDKRNYHPGIPSPWKPHELYRQRFHGSTGPRIVLGSNS